MSDFVAADQFCGGGGTSTGLALTCRELSLQPKLYAMNHWPVALETHARNHPWAVHVSEEIQRLDPLEVVPEGYLNLLLSSPECTYFSIARGGKPTNEQLRSGPYEVVRWMEKLHPEGVLVENVPEFASWGPLDSEGFPIPEKKGITFRIWLGRMKGLGYTVDYRVLNAADYGGATSRKRLFVMARRGSAPISWPLPTHSRGGAKVGTKKWRGAAEVIDWSLMGESLFDRSRPLSYATWRRIIVGLERYGGPEVQPFLRAYKRMTGIEDDPESPREGGPSFILPPLGRTGKNQPRSTRDPLHTIVAGKHSNGHVVQPFVLRTNFDCWKTQGRMGAAPRATDEPLPTVVASNQPLALAEPILVPVVGRRASRGIVPTGVSQPVPTLTGRSGLWLADAVIVPRHGERLGQAPRAHPVSEPMPTVPASGAGLLARGFLVKYYGTGRPASVDDPMPTLTAKDRVALVRPVVIDGKFLDIRLRMIQPHELQGAMGFPKDYQFAGNRTQVVRQIGNAVEVNMARALCSALLAPRARTLDGYAS